MTLRKLIKSVLWLAVFSVVFYLLFIFFKEDILLYLKQYPMILSVYNHVSYQITNNTLLGLFYISFLGGLFFVSIPVEFIAIFYFTLDISPVIVILVIILGNTFGQVFDYLVGAIAGIFAKRHIENSMGNMTLSLHKWGGWLILFGNLFPFPIELLSILLGTIHYHIIRFIMFTAIGKLVKYTALFLFQGYITQNIIPWITNLF